MNQPGLSWHPPPLHGDYFNSRADSQGNPKQPVVFHQDLLLIGYLFHSNAIIYCCLFRIFVHGDYFNGRADSQGMDGLFGGDAGSAPLPTCVPSRLHYEVGKTNEFQGPQNDGVWKAGTVTGPFNYGNFWVSMLDFWGVTYLYIW